MSIPLRVLNQRVFFRALFPFKQCLLVSVHNTNFLISLLDRAFKITKNDVYFIVIALLVAELLKILF